MDKLPRDILVHIFKYLHYKQKLECKYVCRLWAQYLQSGVELDTISIIDPDASLAFIKSRCQVVSTSCKRLTLNVNQPLIKLATLFPRLRFAAFINKDNDNSEEEEEEEDLNEYAEFTPEQAKQFYSWHQHLETFIHLEYSHRINNLLNTGQFQALKTLELRPIDYGSQPLGTLILCLENTPELKVLKVMFFTVRFEDLSRLHNTVPFLNTLVLDFCDIIDDTPLSESNMIPAEAMTRLEIQDEEETFAEYHIVMHRFVAQKYPKLTHLILPTLEDTELPSTNPLDILCNNNLVELKVDCDVSVAVIPNDLKKLMPQSLQKWSVCVAFNSFVLEGVLEFVKCSHIVSLSLMEIPVQDFHLLKNLSKLKRLEISFFIELEDNDAENTIVLNGLMEELPSSLEELSLTNAWVLFVLDQESEPKKVHPSPIKQLELHQCEIRDDLSHFLSIDKFPQLDRLVLRDNAIYHHLMFPDHRFSLVDIRLTGIYFKVKDAVYISHASKEGSLLRSNFDVHDHAMYPVFSRISIISGEYIQFVCKSVHTLLFDDCLILL